MQQPLTELTLDSFIQIFWDALICFESSSTPFPINLRGRRRYRTMNCQDKYAFAFLDICECTF